MSYIRAYVYCTAGHEMVSGPATRQARMEALADEDGCGYGACKAKRGETLSKTVRTA